MNQVQNIAVVRNEIAFARRAGRMIGFVPTMGALHAGHASLIDAAQRDGHYVVVSIFVNPTQFGPSEDFSKYPRTLEADAAICTAHGVDLIFCPQPAEIYPPGDETRVRPGKLADAMCGPFRPGHFEGVCTVVAKLFGIVAADVAYFGQKDAQQLAIIRRMVADLCIPTDIRACPTLREADGLAMSSRNAYLGAEQRKQALSVITSLRRGESLIQGGERRSGVVISAMKRVLTDAGPCRVDYITICNPHTLEELADAKPPAMLATAVRIGETRLIDNIIVT